MKFKQFVRDYFTFTRNERKGVIVLLLIIFVLAIANKMIFYFEKPAKIDDAMFDSASHKLAVFNDSVNLEIQKQALQSKETPDGEEAFSDGSQKADKYKSAKPASSNQLFKFDPNKSSDDEFQQLGFSEKQIVVIRKYIAAGAVFRDKEDFFKIRIITEKQKAVLTPWIEISRVESKPEFVHENIKLASIDINSADSITLEQLPGVGKILSKRIIKYRDLLGGFYTIDQLKEVYGLSETTIKQIEKSITICKSGIHKIDINFGDVRDFSRHPYIKKNLAERIIKFRSGYGNINDLAILRDSMILTNEEYLRIKPYF